jgi:hypothetical protein
MGNKAARAIKQSILWQTRQLKQSRRQQEKQSNTSTGSLALLALLKKQRTLTTKGVVPGGVAQSQPAAKELLQLTC